MQKGTTQKGPMQKGTTQKRTIQIQVLITFKKAFHVLYAYSKSDGS